MTDEPKALEAMSCEELLKELARLTTERDALQAEVGSAAISPGQETRVEDMQRQADQIKQIGEIMANKGC